MMGHMVWSSSPGFVLLLLSALGKPLKWGEKTQQQLSFLKIENEALVGEVLGFRIVLSDPLSSKLSTVQEPASDPQSIHSSIEPVFNQCCLCVQALL